MSEKTKFQKKYEFHEYVFSFHHKYTERTNLSGIANLIWTYLLWKWWTVIKKSWNVQWNLNAFEYFNFNCFRRRELLKWTSNVVNCSTSSQRKQDWRFVAGSTYRTAVFLKRPASAKIYDVGREYSDLNDTLHLRY